MIHLLLGFDDHWLAKTLTQILAHWYSCQTWLISMHRSQKALHFLSVSNGPTYILSDIVITLQKSHEIIFVGYFWKKQKYLREMFLRRLRDVAKKTSFLRYARDVLKTSHKRHFFEMYLRRLKDFTKKSSLLRSSVNDLYWITSTECQQHIKM